MGEHGAGKGPALPGDGHCRRTNRFTCRTQIPSRSDASPCRNRLPNTSRITSIRSTSPMLSPSSFFDNSVPPSPAVPKGTS